MSFLSKVGSVLHKVEGVLTTINPLAGLVGGVVAGLIPGTKDDVVIQKVVGPTGFLEQGTSLIMQTDAFGQALGIPGPDKLKAAAGPMAQIILQSTAFAGKKIANQDLFKAGATKIADGLADCLNAIDQSEVKVQNL